MRLTRTPLLLAILEGLEIPEEFLEKAAKRFRSKRLQRGAKAVRPQGERDLPAGWVYMSPQEKKDWLRRAKESAA